MARTSRKPGVRHGDVRAVRAPAHPSAARRGARSFAGPSPCGRATDVSIAAPLTHFMRATIEWDDDGPWARLTGPQGSGLLTSMARADALIVIPAGQQSFAAGRSEGDLARRACARGRRVRRVTRTAIAAVEASLRRRFRVVETMVPIGSGELSIAPPRKRRGPDRRTRLRARRTTALLGRALAVVARAR